MNFEYPWRGDSENKEDKMNKKLKLGRIDDINHCCGFVTGAAFRQSENEVVRSNFDTGMHISYAFGLTQKKLKDHIQELGEMQQAHRAKVKTAETEAGDDKALLKGVADLTATLKEEMNELRAEVKECELHGFQFSKLREGCATIPAVWLWILQEFRIEEELGWLKPVNVSATREEWEQCHVALGAISRPTLDNKCAAYEVGNPTSLKIAMMLRVLDPFNDELREMKKAINARLDVVRAADVSDVQEEGEVTGAAVEVGGDLKEDDVSEDQKGEVVAEDAKEVEQPEEVVTEALKAAVDKENEDYKAHMSEKVEFSVYPFGLADVGEKCATIPSNFLIALEPCWKDEEAPKDKTAA